MTSSNYSYIITSHLWKADTVQDEQIVLRRSDSLYGYIKFSWNLPNQGNQASQSHRTSWYYEYGCSDSTKSFLSCFEGNWSQYEVQKSRDYWIWIIFSVSLLSHKTLITDHAFNWWFRSPLCLSFQVYLHNFQFKISALKSLYYRLFSQGIKTVYKVFI